MWKLNEARKLASKRADELKAEAAAKPGKSLEELASAQEEGFHGPAPAAVQFSDDRRLSVGQVPDDNGRLRFGRSFQPGQDRRRFMQKVFSLTPNQVDVATNLPKTEIYVIRADRVHALRGTLVGLHRRCGRLVDLHALTPNGISDRTAGLRMMIGDGASAKCRRHGGRRSMPTPELKSAEKRAESRPMPTASCDASRSPRTARRFDDRVRPVRNPAAAPSSGCPTSTAHARPGLFRPRCGRRCGRRESPRREKGCNRQSSRRSRRVPLASCRLRGISISILSKAFIPVVNSRSVPSSLASMRKSIQRCRGRFSGEALRASSRKTCGS